MLAGFASVVAAFQRPLSELQRHRFLTILFGALFQIFACFVPVWFAQTEAVGAGFWSTFSAVQLGWLVLLWAFLVYPLKQLGGVGGIVINRWVTLFVVLLGLAIFVTLAVNTFLTDEANFSMYYSALLGGLAIIFLVFADVVIRSE